MLIFVLALQPLSGFQAGKVVELKSQGGGGGAQKHFLTGMLVREQISTTQKIE